MADLAVQCRCGAVRGSAVVTLNNVNQNICYCTDCRAFVHWLGAEEAVDARGGVGLVQIPRNGLRIDSGFEHLRGVRLGPKGLFRWYAACCRTPIANMVAGLPFAGIAVGALPVPEAQRTAQFGPLLYSATQTALTSDKPKQGPLWRLLRVVYLILKWSVLGRSHPTPFFDRVNQPLAPVQVLTAAERQKLREHARA